MTEGSHIRAVAQKDTLDAQANTQLEAADEPLTLEDDWMEDASDWNPEDADFLADKPDYSWILPAVASTAIAGWTGLFAWSIYPKVLVGTGVDQWIGWLSTWSLPVLLICTIWLLAMRNSKVEARRFSDTASQLGRETSDLEAKLGTINRELSLAREFLGTQTRELEYFGRSAAENLSTHAGTLQNLIQSNGDQVKAIASVSENALENMEKLRDDLPVVATSARDVSNQIGNAGNTAGAQLNTLISGFERLNEFGGASDRQVEAITAKIDKALGEFEGQLGKLDKMSNARFDSLKAKSKAFRNELDNREVDTLAAMQRRADDVKNRVNDVMDEFHAKEEKSLEMLKSRISSMKDESGEIGDALVQSHEDAVKTVTQSKERLYADLAEVFGQLHTMDEKATQSSKERMERLFKEATRFDEILAARDTKFASDIEQRQEQFQEREAAAIAVFDEKLSSMDAGLAERAQDHIKHAEEISQQSKAITDNLFEFNRLIADASQVSEGAKDMFAGNLEELTKRIEENDVRLAKTKASLSELTEDGVRLLEIIQSGAKQSREDLPEAIETAAAKLMKIEERASSLNIAMQGTSEIGSQLSDYVIASHANVEKFDNAVDATNSKLAQSNDDNLAQIHGLQGAMDQLSEANEKLATDTQTRLTDAIQQLDAATQAAFATLDQGLKNSLENSAQEFGGHAIKALEQSIQSHSEEAIMRLEEAAAKAASTGRETAVQLRDQLGKVNELAGNLEQRVTRARNQAEEQIDNDFARRMALITETLNSNAIDISKSLSSDVTDTAWAAYLKGDRGIFTRRAVRLIDNTEARELTELYGNDDDFREHVNRFIHDFEGMLRSVLSTRDGNALGVTVLGSDMGKLYVALAQAIDRLRN